jgi:hypothetical protein
MAIRQMGAVTGSRRLRKKNQILDLEARLSAFPATLAAAERRKQQEATAKFRSDQLAHEKKGQKQAKKQASQTLAFQREQGRKTMGLEAAKLGGSVMSADMGFNIGKKTEAVPYMPMAGMKGGSGGGSMFSNLNIGGGMQGALGGAGIGFGLANMFGKGKKGTKWLGAGLGALAGGAIGSGLLSGLFSGMG